MATQAAIDRFVQQPALALVGLSRSGRKFGNLAYRELMRKGYRVYPIHRSAIEIDGVPCLSRIADIPDHVEAAVLVVPPAEAVSVVRDAAAAGIRQVWLQQGAESAEVLTVCRELGIEPIAGECILMHARPTSYHKVHRWVWQLLGKLPA